jgi:hypothetical protein
MGKDTRNRASVVRYVVMYFKTKVVLVLKQILNSFSLILSTNKPFLNLQMILECPSKQYTGS